MSSLKKIGIIISLIVGIIIIYKFYKESKSETEPDKNAGAEIPQPDIDIVEIDPATVKPTDTEVPTYAIG